MTFTMGMMVGGVATGMVLIMLVPPKYEDWLRLGIINLWNKVTKRG